jgi:hypothetical protein
VTTTFKKGFSLTSNNSIEIAKRGRGKEEWIKTKMK